MDDDKTKKDRIANQETGAFLMIQGVLNIFNTTFGDCEGQSQGLDPVRRWAILSSVEMTSECLTTAICA